MKCPRCDHEGLSFTTPCPECGFTGPPQQIEELAHVRYLLEEIARWQEIPQAAQDQLRARYAQQRRELEIGLGLRPPPLSPEEALEKAREVLCQTQLLHLIDRWREHDWITPPAAEVLAAGARERLKELRARLAEPETPRVSAIDRPADRVALLKSLQSTLDRLRQENVWVDEAAYQAAVADLVQRVERLEIKLGLRPRPKPEAAETPPRPVPSPPPAPPRPPRESITWERVWRTLLSERTLRALLFVGVFLVFVSALTLVLFNWGRFHPWVQVAFLTGFTLLFYVVGWYLRAKMSLQQAGIGFFAVGSLLVPIDFYAIYLSGGIFPRGAWDQVWWLASAVCLVTYTATALLLRAEFFGYLVGTASGSLLCATFQVTNVPTNWWTPPLCGLALLMIAPSRWLERFSLGGVFGRPFRHLALLAVTTVLLLTTGLHLADQIAPLLESIDVFRLTQALDWWLAYAVYAIAAAYRPRRSLTSAACFTLPVALYLTLALWFEQAGIGPAWHALGWALLTPLYLALSRSLVQVPPSETDPPLVKLRRAQGRTVAAWAVLLIVLAAGWGFRDMSAATPTHAVLAGSIVLAVVLWRRPGLLPIASLFSLSVVTTWMAGRGLDLAQFCLGWATLAILHMGLAVLLRRMARYTPWVYAAGFCAAGLSLLPPLIAFDHSLMTYALGNWIALTGWATWLIHRRDEHPGLRRLLHPGVPHWAAAAPLPVWFWLAWTNARAADAWLGVGFAVLAWGCLGLGRWLHRHDKTYGLPWYTIGFVCSVAGPAVSGGYYDQPLLAATLWSAAALYFFYAYLFRRRWWMVPAGFTLPFGYVLTLDHLGLLPDPLAASLALVPTAYILVSIWLERRRGVETRFLEPFYGVAHVVAAATFLWGFVGLWNRVAWNVDWTDEARLWAAGGQLVLGVTYGLAAWFLEEETWGHVAAWLGVVAGGLIATAYSQGRGSSAAKAALLAVIYVLSERALYALRERRRFAAKAWKLYRRPLLIAGWTVSGGAVVLALLRNLVLLGGGPLREDWAIAGLLIVVALYALSARLFKRPIFLWLAAPLLFIPWTIVTHRGWYVWSAPPVPHYALAWTALAWVLLPVGLLLDGLAGRRYGAPLRVTAHVLLPFALLWGSADAVVPSTTFGLGFAFYILAAVADHRCGRKGLAAARFLYPAALLLPLWAVYLLAWQGPWLPHAHYGLLLLALSPLLFAIARCLRRVDSADALPPYLASYGCAIAGTMLVSYIPPLLALALLFDAGLALLSACLMREPLWIYPAAALPPAALLLALAEIDFDLYRRSWWLIGLGAIYLAIAWALRRCAPPLSPPLAGGMPRRGRGGYAIPVMAAAYAVVALGLSIASYEQVAAFWAYGAAAAIYAVSAAWLRQPLLLTPAAGLAVVPYAIAIDRSGWIAPADYGLALWPGIVVALGLAHLLDLGLGAPRDFPWDRPERWLPEAARRLTQWWGLPFYILGYVAALAAVGLSAAHSDRLALALLLTALAYGTATARFRLRGWLLAAVAAVQAAALAAIWAAAQSILPLPQTWTRLLNIPAWQALAFLPVALATAVAGLLVERRRGEGSPFASLHAAWEGWSRPLYWLLALDVLVVQVVSAARAQPGTWVSLAYALLFIALAVIWTQPALPYLAAGLGFLAVFQRLAWIGAPNVDMPWSLALLALGYGVVGYGLEYARSRGGETQTSARLRVLERPLERAGMVVSAIALFLMIVVAGIDVTRWLARALIGRSMMTAADVPAVQMVVTVFSLVGLLYLAAALVRRWYWRGYGAVALLLCAWGLEWFLVWDLREVQWYAIPAGLYLLGVGYLEWRQGRKELARWIDRAALLLILGSSFYQSLAKEYGWPYALLMGAEGLLLIWWGSARRQRRFLYAGVVGVVADVCGQLIRQLFTITNAWIAFGIPGLVILVLVILIERRLEMVKRLSQEWQERLEEWE